MTSGHQDHLVGLNITVVITFHGAMLEFGQDSCNFLNFYSFCLVLYLLNYTELLFGTSFL